MGRASNGNDIAAEYSSGAGERLMVMLKNLVFRFACFVGLHDYQHVELRLSGRPRGVTGRRVCSVCKNEQIRKPWYKNLLNWGGWCDV